MNSLSVIPRLIVASLLALTLAGCGPSEAPANSEAPSSVAATPTADPEPSEAPVELATECSQLVDADTLAQMESALPLQDAESTTRYVDKTRSEAEMYGSSVGNAMFVDNGGLLCLTSNGYAVGELFGYSPITPDQAAAQQDQLLEQGYTITAYRGGDLYSQLTQSDGVVFEYLFAGGYWFCAKTMDRLDETIANSGVPL